MGNSSDTSLMSDCWFGGTINCEYEDAGVGGILGANFDFYDGQPGVTIKNCFVKTTDITCANPENITWIAAVTAGPVTNCYWPNDNNVAVVKLILDETGTSASPDPSFDQSICGRAIGNFTSADLLEELNMNAHNGVTWVSGTGGPTFYWDSRNINTVADYSRVDAAITIANNLNPYNYHNFSAVTAAIEAVVRDKNIDEQIIVDGYAEVIENAIEALVYKGADYTLVNAAIAIANNLNPNHYQDFTSVTAAIEAVVRDKDFTQQTIVDGYVIAIENAIKTLVYKGADYTKVDVAITIANNLDPNHYQDFTAVTDAIEAVVRNKNITEQTIVDGYAEVIENAIEALVYKGADYTKVDEAIAIANNLNPYDYHNFTAVTDAIEAVVHDKNITEQTIVDDYAAAIENAIKALVIRYIGGYDGNTEKNVNDNYTIIPSKPTEIDSTPPTRGEIKVSTTVDNDGNVQVKILDSNIKDIIQMAQNQAKNDGTTANGIAITVNVDVKSNANSLNLIHTQETLDRLIAAKSTNFTIKNSSINLSFDLQALQQIKKQSIGDISITATKQDVKKLSAEAQIAIGNRPVFNITESYQMGGKTVYMTEYGNGNILVSIPYTMSKNEVSSNLCGVYVDGSGNVTWMDSSSYDPHTGTMLITTTHFSVFGVGYKQITPKFTDTTDHWAKNDIDFVVARGLLSGTSDTIFSSNQSMTRGMFVTALGRLAGVDTNKFTNAKFSDAKVDAYYTPYVAWASENNIVNGTSDTTFSPDKAVTRQEMAVMLVNYSNAIWYKLPAVHAQIAFADSSNIASWANYVVQQMQMAGILMGKSDNQFDPTATATRAEVSAMLRRYVELVMSTETA